MVSVGNGKWNEKVKLDLKLFRSYKKIKTHSFVSLQEDISKKKLLSCSEALLQEKDCGVDFSRSRSQDVCPESVSMQLLEPQGLF